MFSAVKLGPPDAIFLVKEKYQKDTFAGKIDVGIGAYRDTNGKPYVLPVVRKAEEILLADKKENKEYLGIAGNTTFISCTQKFCFGEENKAYKENRIATVQTLSGTGALRVGAEFLSKCYGKPTKVFVPSPTWGNHNKIFGNAGLEVGSYTYWRPANRDLNYEAMIQDLSKMPAGSVVVLHVCSHNPTGVDPTPEQWNGILKVVKERQLLPFFDSAYQGFASGDVDKDAYAVRLFADNGVELLVAQSYSKNMGLYGERIGALNIVTNNPSEVPALLSQLKIVIRAMYSNPPRHGAGIAGLILSTPELMKEWKEQLKGMTDRIASMRVALRNALEKLDTGNNYDWSFITSQIGMFTYTGLNKEQVEEMQKNHHIYMPGNGRISIAGLTPGSIDKMAEAIWSVTGAVNCKL